MLFSKITNKGSSSDKLRGKPTLPPSPTPSPHLFKSMARKKFVFNFESPLPLLIVYYIVYFYPMNSQKIFSILNTLYA